MRLIKRSISSKPLLLIDSRILLTYNRTDLWMLVRRIDVTSSVTCLSSKNVFILLGETIFWFTQCGIFDEMLVSLKYQVSGFGGEDGEDCSSVDRVMNARRLTCGYKSQTLVSLWVFKAKCHSTCQDIFFTVARDARKWQFSKSVVIHEKYTCWRQRVLSLQCIVVCLFSSVF